MCLILMTNIPQAGSITDNRQPLSALIGENCRSTRLINCSGRHLNELRGCLQSYFWMRWNNLSSLKPMNIQIYNSTISTENRIAMMPMFCHCLHHRFLLSDKQFGIMTYLRYQWYQSSISWRMITCVSTCKFRIFLMPYVITRPQCVKS